MIVFGLLSPHQVFTILAILINFTFITQKKLYFKDTGYTYD